MKSLSILGVKLTAQTFDDATRRLLEAAATGTRVRAHFCNVHTIVEAVDDPALRRVYETASFVAMDGMPLVWIARLRGFPRSERVTGPDMMLALCDRGRALGLRHYFLGGQQGVAERLGERLTTKFPGLVIVGTESPPFRSLTPSESASQVERINKARPHVLWVGLGAPKQEFWASENEPHLDVAVILPVGAAFDFHSGRIRRAPGWMQRRGLEWSYRLAADPSRLWRRYLVTNARFLVLAVADELAHRRRRSGS